MDEVYSTPPEWLALSQPADDGWLYMAVSVTMLLAATALLLTVAVFLIRYVMDRRRIRRQIFDGIAIPVMIFSPRLRLTFANRSSRELFGSEIERFSHRPRAGAEPGLIALTRRDMRPHSEMLTRNGREIIVSTQPIISPKGALEFIILSAAAADCDNLQQREITELTRDRRLVLANIRVPICLFDKTGKLIRMNPAAAVLSGKSMDETLAQPCFESFCREDHVPDFCPVRKTIQTGRAASCEMKIGEREYIIAADPIPDEKGELVNVILSAVDVTGVNEARRKMEQAVEEARRADHAKSIFVATMSHELRTPLNAVIGFSELLQTTEMTEAERNEYLKSINFAGNALLRLINDLLDLSKLEADQLEVVPGKIDFRELLQDIEALFRHQAEAKHLSFSVRIETAIPPLYVDSLRLRQILLNITGNAIKFTNEGSVAIRAGFSPARTGTGILTIRVIDTGIGIPENFLTKVFEPFVQQNAVRDAHGLEGSGLGLAISQRLANKMGGRIMLESTLGKGSTFTVRFDNVRYEAAPNPEEKAAEEKPEAAASTPRLAGATVRKLGGNREILVVDDVVMNQKVLAAMLRKMGFQPFTASNGTEALAMMASRHFPIVLSDMWMPGMNGDELAQAIREMPAYKNVRIYAITADVEARNNFDVSAFTGLIHKPVVFEKLEGILFGGETGNE